MPSEFLRTPARRIKAERANPAVRPEDAAAARAERWLEENRGALDSSNAWVESNGLPLAKHRLF